MRTRPPRARWLIPAVLVLTACSGQPGASPSATSSSAVATEAPTPSVEASPSASASSETAPTATATVGPGALAWNELPQTGGTPAPREDHSWTVDPGAEVAYLFGGRAGPGGTDFGDLWAYDLALDTWSAITPQGPTPPPRFGHNAAWVPEVGLVVFAGQAGATFYSDLWAYDPPSNTWTQLPAEGDAPVPRYGSCAALGPDGRLWISHGFTEEGNRFSDTRAYDFEAGAWSDETPDGMPPVARCLHGCFWTPDGASFVLYAGQTTGVYSLGDLWALTPDAGWTRLDEPPTATRNLYAFAPRAGDTVVFGGETEEGSFPTDTFSFDVGLNFAPIEAAVIPPGRRGAQLIDDSNAGRVLLWGGLNTDGPLADLWELALP